MSEQDVSELEVTEQEVIEPVVTEQEVSKQEVNSLETSQNSETPGNLEGQIIEVLHTCFDPEIPVDIYELGLIYGIDIQPSGEVNIRMTLTSPGCPVAGSLPGEVEAKVASVSGVSSAKVELVWDPPWCMDNMSEAAKLQLGMF